MANTKKRLQRAWKIIKNPYIATLIIFFILLCFGENNIFVTLRLRQELSELKKEEKTLRDEMRHDSANIEVLQGDLSAIERYGREVYYLRRANEEVYVFEK